MKSGKLLITIIIYLAVHSITPAYADNNAAIIFASNNTNIIDVKLAYKRLIGMPQHQLHNTMIGILQRDHMQQGKFESVLGAYQMLSPQKLTADNSQIFYASPLQSLSNEDVFKVAQHLAVALKQESVATFIPNSQSPIGDIEVVFPSHLPSIDKVVNAVNQQLPSSNYQAFTLHLDLKGLNALSPKVTKIEWLGSHAKLEEIKKAFPTNKIIFHSGSAFLVYKNGAVDSL